MSRPAVIPTGRRLSLAVPEPLTWVIIAMFVAFAVRNGPLAVVQDTWMCLLAGREVAQHGLPHADSFTVMGRGHTWIDQQWLAQLALYGVFALGGLALLSVVNVAVLAASLVAAMRKGRQSASARSTVLVGAAFGVMLVWSTVRAQSLAYPLFVGVVWLLINDARRPSSRVLWTLPLLVLWANVHGSVIIGAGLVVLRGISLIVGRGHTRDARRTGMLLMLAPAAVLVTPYGVDMVGYYRSVLIGSPIAGHVGEWQPASLATDPWFIVVALATVGLVARAATLTRFDRALLLLLVVAGLQAQRNAVWLALAAPMLLPAEVDRLLPASYDIARDRVVQLAGIFAVVVLGAATLQAATRSNADMLSRYPSGALAAVQHATRTPGTRVFASDAQSDWLLYELPGLRGRVAYDVRFELLTRRQFDSIDRFHTYAADWYTALRGYEVAVLDLNQDGKQIAALTRLGANALYRDGSMVILRLPPHL